MKVDPPLTPAQSSRVIKTNEKATPTAVETGQPKTAQASSKSRINQWFSRIGIPPNLSLASAHEKSRVIANKTKLRAELKVTNLSNIFDMALDVAISETASDQVDPDWFYAFCDMAENIYSPDMQELWSKILAVEVSRPGSFSLKTLETLRQLTQRDAKLFSAACRLSSRRQGDSVPRIITDYHQRKTLTRWFVSRPRVPVNLANHGLSYPSLLALIDLGLVVGNEIESAEFPLNKSVPFRCGEKNFGLKAKRNGVALAYYKFTNVGAELSKLTKRHEHPDYLEELKKVLSPAFSVQL